MDIKYFLPLLQGVRETDPETWAAICPCHDKDGTGTHPLKITLGPHNIRIHCPRDCSSNEIMAALGLSMKDLFFGDTAKPKKPAHKQEPSGKGKKGKAKTKKLLSPFELAHDILGYYFVPPKKEHEMHDETWALKYWNEAFWQWTGDCYHLLPYDELECMISHYFQVMGQDFIDEFLGSFTGAKITNTILSLKGLVHIPASITPPAWLPAINEPKEPIVLAHGNLAMKNKILNISTMLFIENDSEFKCEQDIFHEMITIPKTARLFSLASLPFDYDPDARCPRWMAFLQEMFPDSSVRTLIQKMFGWTLIPGQHTNKFFIFVGEGGNGKTVVLQTLTNMLGPDNVSCAPLELFGTRFGLGPTANKLANIVDDLGETDKFDEGHLKAYTGGGTIQVEQKFKNPLTMKPTAKLIFSCNTPPSFREKTNALWRRLIVIPCEGEKPEADQDKKLADKIRDEELPGVFNWALAGLSVLHTAGYDFQEPEICRVAREAHRNEANPARRFILECYTEGSGADRIISRTIYDDYKKWIDDNGHKPLAEIQFSKELRRIFPNIEKAQYLADGKRAMTWFGIKKITPEMTIFSREEKVPF